MQRAQLHIPCTELARRYNQREPLEEIAASYGCSPSTIMRRLNRCGITRRREPALRRNVPAEQLRQLYLDDGLPLSAIARVLNVGRSTIAARLQLYTIPPRHTTAPSRTIVALWRNGFSIETIARLVHVRAQAVVALTHHLVLQSKPGVEPPLSETQRAYLTGLRRGWMQSEYTQQGDILVYVTTGDRVLQRLFVEALADYGPRRVELVAGYYVLSVRVPRGWGFLVPETDQLPNWLRATPELIIIFLAGLFDGTGSLSTVGALRLVVDAPWPNSLKQLADELQHMDLEVEVALQPSRQQEPGRLRVVSGARWLLSEIAPYLRHRKRRRLVQHVLQRR